MTMIEIIPAIDLIEGKCVRLTQGDFARSTVYNDDPLEVAKSFEDAGISRLHLVDLDGAKNGSITNLKVLESIAKNTRLKVDFGGGIKTAEDIASVFDSGAAIATIGSTAVRDPDLFYGSIDLYGSHKILLGADVRDGKLSVSGWQVATEIELMQFLRECYLNKVTQVFVTDIAKDGCMQGPSVQLYEEIRSELPGLTLIASGGVRSIEDIEELEQIGCSGVIVGKAIYENQIDINNFAFRKSGPQK